MAVRYNRQEKKHHANYVVVFIALSILTAIEIAVTQLPLPKVPILVPLSIIKASLVALFYMHLRSDRRIFSAAFGFGALVGLALLGSFLFLMNTPFGGIHTP